MRYATRNAKHDYLLRGRIYCGEHRGTNGAPRIYQGKNVRGKLWYTCPVGKCRKPYILVSQIDGYVKARISVVLNAQPDDFYQMLKKPTFSPEKIEKELATLERQKDRTYIKEAKLVDIYFDGTLSREAYNLKRQSIDTERQGINHQQNDLLQKLASVKQRDEVIKGLMSLRYSIAKQYDPIGNLPESEWTKIIATLDPKITVNSTEQREQAIQDMAVDALDGDDFDDLGPEEDAAEILRNYKGFDPRIDITVELAIRLKPEMLKGTIVLALAEQGS